jgi:hypothetical protein
VWVGGIAGYGRGLDPAGLAAAAGFETRQAETHKQLILRVCIVIGTLALRNDAGKI